VSTPNEHAREADVREDPAAAEVRRELERILASPDFRSSRRNADFLRFVVEEVLAGRGERIKAYTIAVQLLGRAEDFDPVADSVVRTQAGRVRRALERYYLTDGASDPLQICIPSGTYRPAFSAAGPPAGPSSRLEDPRDEFLAEPTLAVDSLVNLSPDHLSELLVCGISQELATALARFEALRVLPPATMSATNTSLEMPPGSLRRTEADFHLSGTVAYSKETLRVSLTLQDQKSGEVLWSAPFLRQMSDENAFAVQTEVAREAACLLADFAGAIPRALLVRYAGTRSTDLPFYPAIFRYMNTPTRSRTQYMALYQALVRMLQNAPHHAFAHAMMAEACIHDYNYMFECTEAPLDVALSFARRAVGLDSGSQFAEMVLAYAYVQRRELEQFFVHADRCVELNPDACLPTGHIGVCFVLADEWERGLALVRRSMQLNPSYYRYFHHATFLDHFRRGEYRAALAEARLFNTPGFFWAPLLRAAALGRLGQLDEARQAVAELISLRPDFALCGRQLVGRFVHSDKIQDDIFAGLDAAGLAVSG
jgi:adenylate cyclase